MFFHAIMVFSGALLVSIGLMYVYWVLLNRRFCTVEKNRVYRSGALGLKKLQEKITAHRIRTVIDLRRDKHDGSIDAESRFLEKLGVRHIHLRSQQVPQQAVVESFLRIMQNDDIYPVLIHCTHGRGRAVLFSAIYLIEHFGRSRLATCVSLFWNPLLGSFNPFSRKGKFLLTYCPRSHHRLSGEFR